MRQLSGVEAQLEQSPTLLAAMGESGNNKPCVAYTLKVRSGCDIDSAGKSAGKGALVQTEKAATLACVQDQYLFQPTAYSFDSLASNSMKSSNPHSGCREVEVAKTLDTTDPNPSKNQGGIAIVEPTAILDNIGGQAEYGKVTHVNGTLRSAAQGAVAFGINGDLAGTLDASYHKGCGMRQGVERDVVAFEIYQEVTGPLMANSHPGSYTGQDAFSDRLVAGPTQGPIYTIDRETFNCGQNYARNLGISDEGVVPTLKAVGPGAVVHSVAPIHYIVRRLTPTECARLQGFADQHGHLEQKTELTEEEYSFWMEVRNTHAAINGKVVKDYTKPQMLTWYNKLWTDSAEYKMWGNGIALPPALYCMQGIMDVLNREEDDTWLL